MDNKNYYILSKFKNPNNGYYGEILYNIKCLHPKYGAFSVLATEKEIQKKEGE